MPPTSRLDPARAQKEVKDHLELYCLEGSRGGIRRCLYELAYWAMAQGQTDRAICLLGAVEKMGEAINPTGLSHHPQVDLMVRTAEDLLGAVKVGHLWERGRNMSVEEAIEYALET